MTKFGKPETCPKFPIWWKSVRKSMTNGWKKGKKKRRKKTQNTPTKQTKIPSKPLYDKKKNIFVIIDIHLLSRYNWLKY